MLFVCCSSKYCTASSNVTFVHIHVTTSLSLHGLSVHLLQGFALEKLIASRARRSDESERVVAKVQIWSDHAELLQLVKLAMRQ